jgi:hypothetical protein
MFPKLGNENPSDPSLLHLDALDDNFDNLGHLENAF